ncbi:MAG TPA: hypothetical protein VMW78_04150 [Anaerolineae bacterium]|nr:hypothetical protein [Anaerolineae bacterium]
MLKKVMIICLALSFVFVGGIGIVLAFDHIGPPEVPPMGPRGDQDGDCQNFISHDSSIIIAGYDDDKGKGDQDKLRDGSCLPFTRHDSSMILALDDCDGPYGPNGGDAGDGPHGPGDCICGC